ncbi:MAG TPA: sulfate ABC transporter substrate-binding protein [Gaiellaceae bacterium]|nr:sulfate ABC transporter substrate-binding protein [Gaiellaceae bacterium]
MKAIWIALPLVALLAGSAAGASKGTTISLVAYSTPKDAYGKIISAFQNTAAGKGVSFTQSYGASGDQARAVAAGQPADVLNLSLDPDIDLLVKKGLVPKNWKANAHKGIVNDSVVVFVVRDGNPKRIKRWQDLIKAGVSVITPNPFTSGGARWNVMAAYGALRRQGKSDKQAIQYLSRLFHHVPVQPDSARTALQVFAQGQGDVLLTYENDAIYAEKKGVHTQYQIPKATLLIETPAALTKSGLQKPAAKAFYKYLWSATAQKAFADQGYRPVLKSVAKNYHFVRPPGLFTVTSKQWGLNGWTKVNHRFFDPNNGIMAKIERSLGH